jgi:Fe-S-cluster containining protein
MSVCKPNEKRPRPSQFAASPVLKDLYAGECQRCGMCCSYFARPGRANGLMLGCSDEKLPEWLVESYHGSKMLRILPEPAWPLYHRCAALEGDLGERVSCKAYEERPRMCKEFEPGSAYCMIVRSWGYMEPLEDGLGRS